MFEILLRTKYETKIESLHYVNMIECAVHIANAYCPCQDKTDKTDNVARQRFSKSMCKLISYHVYNIKYSWFLVSKSLMNLNQLCIIVPFREFGDLDLANAY